MVLNIKITRHLGVKSTSITCCKACDICVYVLSAFCKDKKCIDERPQSDSGACHQLYFQSSPEERNGKFSHLCV